jgi:ascorbate-specific PTS system EIIC-type component UlaA
MTEDASDSGKSISVPEVKYFDKATEQVGHFDRLMVTLFSGLIAGIALLLLRQEVSAWVGGFLLVSLGMFVLGIGHALLHITFHNKMLLLLEALVNGTEHVPNMIEREEPTTKAYLRMQTYAQRAYTGQILYLFLGVVIAAVAVVLRLWCYSWRAGVLLAVVATVVLAAALAVRLWLKVILARTPHEGKRQEH